MRPIIYPYKMGSRSAKALAEELKRRGHRALRVRPDGRYKPYRNHLIINWGMSAAPNWSGLYVMRGLNDPSNITVASNKLYAFDILKAAGVSIPEYTTDKEVANEWRRNGEVVVARTILNGHSGRGIVLCDGNQAIVPAPLYVKYIKKQDEYRVHVFNGKVIDVQQKRRSLDVPDERVNWQIRNHANGFIFARDNCNPDGSVLSNAIAAIDALSLDFGAVDIIWNAHSREAFVLEVNTAPGLEGTTLTKYADAVEELL